MENQNKQAQLFTKSKLSLLGEMAAGVAHEINNPLAIISGKAQVILSRLRGMDLDQNEKTKILDSLNTIKLTVERIAVIVKGLKSFSRDSENDPHHQVNAMKIIEDVMTLTKERTLNRGIVMRVENDIPDVSLFCNEVQIGQILMNLISNSIDAIENLPEKWIRISLSKNGAFAQFKVLDSGTGISLNTTEKMMQPFFTTKDVGKGTGLGLSITKGIIERHLGSLTYETVNGHACFTILIPHAEDGISSHYKAS